MVRTGTPQGLLHEATLYKGVDDFVDHTASFVTDGLAAGEPVLVMAVPGKIELLRGALGREADRVEFKDMEKVGLNPARIIPAWADFVSDRANGGRVRGIGEPIWSGRGAPEVAEAHRHEALINLALGGADATILCPYDVETLDAGVIEEALRSHPVVWSTGERRASPGYVGLDAIASPFTEPLPPPTARPVEMLVTPELGAIRRFVARHATAFGLSAERVSDYVLAVDEVTTNTLRHAGGRGTLRTWVEGDTLIFEVADDGVIADPLVGRARPSAEEGGFGLWIVNQLCDLVQVRAVGNDSVIRLHMRR